MKKLPHRKGMTLLSRPVRKPISAWNNLELDAKLTRFGITWYRVKGGFGGRGDREDWVADVSVCLSVSHYNWDGSWVKWLNYGSFDKAIYGETKDALDSARKSVVEASRKLSELKRSVVVLERAVRKGKKS